MKKYVKILKRHLGVPKAHIEIVADFVFSEAVPGDYLEFGVFRGSSFVAAYKTLEHCRQDWTSKKRNELAYSDKTRADGNKLVQKNDLRYFAFDSFDGLPEIKGIDQSSARFSRGRYDCGQDVFVSVLKKNGVDLSKVVLVPGWFDQSLTAEVKKRHNLRAASVVMIDCDLYESTKPVLEFITDLLVDGTILIFDDWFSFKGDPDKGEQRATREWLNKNPQIKLQDYYQVGSTQKSFIVNLKK